MIVNLTHTENIMNGEVAGRAFPPLSQGPYLGQTPVRGPEGLTNGLKDRPQLFAAAAHDVGNATEQLYGLIGHARTIADSVFGVQTSGSGATNAPAPTPTGNAALLGERTQALFSAIAELRTQIERLSCI